MTFQIFSYDSENSQNPFHLVSTGLYTSYCLTQVFFVRIESHVYCCTASTDGYLALWPLNLEIKLEELNGSVEAASRYDTSLGLIILGNSLSFSERVQVHQSSVNCVSTINLSKTDVLVATVGDDGAMAIWRLQGMTVNESTSPTGHPSKRLAIQHSIIIVPKAHASTIDALIYLDSMTDRTDHESSYQFATCGKDQRLKIWKVTASLEHVGIHGFTIIKEQDIYSRIADASTLACSIMNDQSSHCVVVAGIGMEMHRVAGVQWHLS